MGKITKVDRVRWWLQWAYVRVIGALVRRAFWACDHGNTIVLDMTRCYPMCELCARNTIIEFHDSMDELRDELQRTRSKKMRAVLEEIAKHPDTCAAELIRVLNCDIDELQFPKGAA